MNLLLDTHIALWALIDAPKLPLRAKEMIQDAGANVYVSAGSVWEIAVKHALGRERHDAIPISGEDALRLFDGAGFQMVSITPRHAAAVEQLPLLHRDPFDRILVAQAIAEPLRLLTRDPVLQRYTDLVITV